MNEETLRAALAQLAPELIEVRRALHRIPELSRQERRTQDYICERLQSLGIEHRKVADTGVYAVVRTGKPGKTIAFRGDMDGLAVSEDTGLPYASAHVGQMHACGHDAHMTFLLGAAQLLQQRRAGLRGNFVFLFQPAEERFGGAKRMIAEGVLEQPHVDAIVGAHVWELPVGTVAVRSGPTMACPDIFRITYRGKGGHGGAPHLARNPIPALGALTGALGQVSALGHDPQQAVALSVCQIHAGETYNVIPEVGYLEGTLRTYDEAVRADMIARIHTAAQGVAAAHGMECEVWFDPDAYLATINDPALARWALRQLEAQPGITQVCADVPPAMAGEDFSYFQRERPGVMLWVGVQNEENREFCKLHHPRFAIDENAIACGVYSLCVLAERFVLE